MTAENREEITRFVEQSEAFRGLPAEARASLVAAAGLRRLAADQAVFQRGESGDSLFFVLSGQVRITLQLPQGDQVVSILKPDDFFGEIALMTRSRRTASVTAMVESTVLEFPAAAVTPLLEKYPEFKSVIARRGAQRSRESLEKMIED